MIKTFANLFGYVLKYIYSFIGNYGVAIILFSILLKILQLPLSIKQQKNIKKTEKIQGELAVIREKNKKNPEKLNQETMALYKRENMNPFGGCFSSIIQIILILAMFSLVRMPLTYMLKISDDDIKGVLQYIKEDDKEIASTYPQIEILKFANNNEKREITIKSQSGEEVKEFNLEQLKINMKFLGLDLSDIPNQNFHDIKVFIIPLLYVVSSIISIKLTTAKSKKDNNQNKNDGNEEDMMGQMGKSMSLTMPIIAVSVSLLAPLGLALYWLTNNILMIIERIVINRVFLKEEEEKQDA